MANHYLTAAFTLRMRAVDAEMIPLAEEASAILSNAFEDDDLKAAYAALGDRFAALFPAEGASSFGSFLKLFDDPEFPTFDCDITIGAPDEDGWCEVYFCGQQFGVQAVAQLIFTACKSALPCAFSWAFTCDRLRPGEFGGGCVVMTEAGIEFHSTNGIIDRAIAHVAFGEAEGLHGFVLARREARGGLGFWNIDSGFGLLAGATVFNEDQAAAYTHPEAGDETEWLALPPPLSV